MIFAVCVRPCRSCSQTPAPSKAVEQRKASRTRIPRRSNRGGLPSSRRRPLRAQSQRLRPRQGACHEKLLEIELVRSRRRRCDRLGRLDRDRGRRSGSRGPGGETGSALGTGFGSGSASSFSSLLTRRSSVLRERSKLRSASRGRIRPFPYPLYSKFEISGQAGPAPDRCLATRAALTTRPLRSSIVTG